MVQISIRPFRSQIFPNIRKIFVVVTEISVCGLHRIFSYSWKISMQRYGKVVPVCKNLMVFNGYYQIGHYLSISSISWSIPGLYFTYDLMQNWRNSATNYPLDSRFYDWNLANWSGQMIARCWMLFLPDARTIGDLCSVSTAHTTMLTTSSRQVAARKTNRLTNKRGLLSFKRDPSFDQMIGH